MDNNYETTKSSSLILIINPLPPLFQCWFVNTGHCGLLIMTQHCYWGVGGLICLKIFCPRLYYSFNTSKVRISMIWTENPINLYIFWVSDSIPIILSTIEHVLRNFMVSLLQENAEKFSRIDCDSCLLLRPVLYVGAWNSMSMS